MLRSIQQDFIIDHPLPRVWWALTASSAIAEWAYPNDFEPCVGREFTLRPPPNPKADFDGTVRGRVLECSSPKRLRYSWQGGPVVGTTVTFDLEPQGNGTRLRFEHAGFDLSQAWGENALKGAEYGWKLMLSKLTAVASHAPDAASSTE